MDELTDTAMAAAEERGRTEFVTLPHARAVSFDRRTGMMTLSLYNGCAFTFRPRDLQGMADATDAQIEAVDLGLTGDALEWDELDTQISVAGLLAGRFGNQRFMAARHAELAAIYDKLVAGSDDAWTAQAAE